MADHKAPTEVTVVPHEEKSAFADFVEKQWPKGAVIAILVTGFILYGQWQKGQEVQSVDQSWNRLMSAVGQDSRGDLIGDPLLIDGLGDQLDGTIAAPWALFMKAQGYRIDGEYERAVQTLLEIKAKFPDHPLVKDTHNYGESVTPLSTVEYLTKVYNGEAEWREIQPRLFSNPEPPAGSPRVSIQTDYGDIVVALYSDLAPLHSENFAKLVNEGFYNGIKFHRTGFGQLLEAGDPTTKEEGSDPLTWGNQGADYTLEVEENDLSNFAGYLAAGSLPEEEGSNGSLFSISARGIHYLDGQNVIFGKVIEGMDVVEEIAILPLDETRQRPLDPVIIQSMTMVPGA
jgi:cyclophilin family peptidyl-prolyl cis-trans isomerase